MSQPARRRGRLAGRTGACAPLVRTVISTASRGRRHPSQRLVQLDADCRRVSVAPGAAGRTHDRSASTATSEKPACRCLTRITDPSTHPSPRDRMGNRCSVLRTSSMAALTSDLGRRNIARKRGRAPVLMSDDTRQGRDHLVVPQRFCTHAPSAQRRTARLRSANALHFRGCSVGSQTNWPRRPTGIAARAESQGVRLDGGGPHARVCA